MTKRRILITNGLPYANGPIHLGHMVETIQTDVFARAMRMSGHEVVYVCGDDTHGTPVEISAAQQGITPETLIGRMWESHKKDFDGFDIGFSFYHTTHSEETRALANEIFASLQARGCITEEVVKQLYSEKLERFLPDRYVKGTCPKCGAPDQYGDTCEVCKGRYEATELINPRCVLDDSIPVVRESNHLFLSFGDLTEDLRAFVNSPALSDEVRNFALAWIDEGLKSWNISRDKPYFGFEIPGYPDKFYYVWMDAPIGYIGATKAWCDVHHQSLDEYWRNDNVEIWQFIGKDIIYFHTLFWPAMLKAARFSLPHRIHVHGFLTVNGKKMSKSRGTFILASHYLDVLPAAFLRFYFAAKLSSGIDDIDLNIEDFYFRVRSGLVDNLANLHNRSFSFAETKLGGQLDDAHYDDDCRALIAFARASLSDVVADYEALDTASAVRRLCEIGDKANLFYQEKAPWALLKGENADLDKARAIVTACAEVVRVIAIGLKPIVPDFSAKIFAQLGIGDQNLSDLRSGLSATHRIANVEKTYLRPERETFDALTVAETKSEAAVVEPETKVAGADVLPGAEPVVAATATAAAELRALKSFISYEDFDKIDIRVGRVLACDKVKKSNKLLCCKVDIGLPTGPVQIVAGIAKHYEPESLINRHVLVLANLAPRMLFGLESHGMILAASDLGGLELPGTLLRASGASVS